MDYKPRSSFSDTSPKNPTSPSSAQRIRAHKAEQREKSNGKKNFDWSEYKSFDWSTVDWSEYKKEWANTESMGEVIPFIHALSLEVVS